MVTIAGRFDTSDPRFPLHPDDVEAMNVIFSRTVERLGHTPDPVWRYGWPVRYRIDWNDRDHPDRLGSLAGFEVVTDQARCMTTEENPDD